MNLNDIYGNQRVKARNGITVLDICENMNDNAKVIYYFIERDIFLGCKIKNTPRKIMKYNVLYVEAHYDTLNIYIQEIKEKKIMREKFKRKVVVNGIYDTKKYRWIYDSNTNVILRKPIVHLDTVKALGEWEIVERNVLK